MPETDRLHLSSTPRVHLAFLPTPLKEATRLSAELEGPPLWIKRDDLTGFGFGGNKIRGLEFLLADALAQGADTLVTGAGPQSNYVRATAAAAAYSGLAMVAVYAGTPPVREQGNYLLTRLLGAEIRFTGDPNRASVDRVIETVAAGLSRAGRHPYVIPRGGACILGTLGYVLAAQELAEQCAALAIQPTALVLAIGSCGTHAGLLAGTHALQLPWRIEGFTVSRPVAEARSRVHSLAQSALGRLGLPRTIAEQEVIVHDGFIGPGYGIPTAEGRAATQLVARSEGIFLDPTYTGKAMAGLLAQYRARRCGSDETYIFLHTGGEPGLFADEGSTLYE